MVTQSTSRESPPNFSAGSAYKSTQGCCNPCCLSTFFYHTVKILILFSIPVSSVYGQGWASAYLQRSTGYTWTGRQPIPGQHRDTQDKQPCTHPFTLKDNVERPINLTVMFLDRGRKPEYLERTHACTGKTCKLHAKRPLAGS
ncbi:hypothetical protein ATANTOWER_000209 [Ataeniobius toweri]|uniref:Uncharacterized protein n=1 Tax=Ataeniobius toweri TaxID=208326 RepID=A0ABU7BPP6_9TELE|nr:hypothetical protein [Ataeniobius toweri]